MIDQCTHQDTQWEFVECKQTEEWWRCLECKELIMRYVDGCGG